MPDHHEVETIPLPDLTRADAVALYRLAHIVWENAPDPEAKADALLAAAGGPSAPGQLHLVRGSGGIIAKAHSFGREIATPRGRLRVMALAGVCSAPDHRGEGLGKAVAQAALARVDGGEFPLSLFQTGVPDFYRKLGARCVGNRFVDSQADDPQANPWWNDYVMIYPAEADWPEGEIDLLGPAW
ncbi:MAG: GNAT family N-acetyltransferase [Planctomycetota bacterium]